MPLYHFTFQNDGLLPLKFEEEKSVTGFYLLSRLKEDLPVKEVVAMRVDGCLRDLSYVLPQKAEIFWILKNTPEGLDVLRHTGAHILAQAVQSLFEGTEVTIGPVIENGFYYDFHRSTPFTPEDLRKIEEKMKDLVKQDLKVVRHEWDRPQTIAFFENKKEFFKVEIIKSLEESEVLSVYQQGDFYDLCKGPHLPSTGYFGKAFCLTKVSGAYWRGDSKNQQLQRIYGVAFASEQDLANYLHMIQEAEKNDHRILGKEMDLFHFQEEAPGCVFWHPKGFTIYKALQEYIRSALKAHDYQEVNTPTVVSRTLWEKSGHWEKFKENMFCLEHDNTPYALKPMNCPCHVQIFNQGLKSYKDLPLRMAEFGSCMRDEPSGALSGLMRLRGFVQDDAHIFCTTDQIISETQKFCSLLLSVYKDIGFDEVIVRFSSRPEVRLGSDALWDKAEKALCEGADAAGLSYTEFKGEGAFYGPKLEFVLKDRLGRLWQCGTLQADFVLPERLQAYYTDADGEKKHPVMLHRAIFGSIERFIGILIEHYGGRLPFWLSPVQCVIASISEKTQDYAKKVYEEFKKEGLLVALDIRAEKIGYKVREHTLQKVPCIIVLGPKEAEEQTVTMRLRDQEGTLTKPLSKALESLKQIAQSRKDMIQFFKTQKEDV